MNISDDIESGFIGVIDEEHYIGTALTDVETISVKSVNVLARGRRYGRLWLLKGLRPELRGSSAHRLQMMKEFEIQSRLHHESVAQAVSFEDVEGLGPCIVQEWIEGKTLHELLRQGELSKKDRLRLMREIIDAVAYLHSCGVVHRDLKPSNIMVRSAGGSPVLIDFGLADTGNYVELKHPAGTAGYVSPEHQEGAAASPADDVYSLGAIMHDLYPEYGGIARRLSGPAAKRPANAMAVKHILDRHSRRRRLIAASLAVAAAACVFALAAMRISALNQDVDSARHQTAMLTDSLSHMQTRLTVAQSELDKIEAYEQAKKSAMGGGTQRIDSLLSAYDNRISTRQVTQDDFTQLLGTLNTEVNLIIDSHSAALDTVTLSPLDRQIIRNDLFNYYTFSLSDYHKKWIMDIYHVSI